MYPMHQRCSFHHPAHQPIDLIVAEYDLNWLSFVSTNIEFTYYWPIELLTCFVFITLYLFYHSLYKILLIFHWLLISSIIDYWFFTDYWFHRLLIPPIIFLVLIIPLIINFNDSYFNLLLISPSINFYRLLILPIINFTYYQFHQVLIYSFSSSQYYTSNTFIYLDYRTR